MRKQGADEGGKRESGGRGRGKEKWREGWTEGERWGEGGRGRDGGKGGQRERGEGEVERQKMGMERRAGSGEKGVR